MTILLYVRRKGWPLESVTIESEHERVHCRDSERCEEPGKAFIEVIRRRILLEGDLDEAQRERIAYIATRCPVHRTLQEKPRIEDVVELVG
jgi:putative redox protein